MEKDTIEIQVNGHSHTFVNNPSATLLTILRNELGLYAAKYGCGLGQCGACTVLVGSEAVQSCNFPIGKVGNREVTTLEGLPEDDALVSAFIENDAAQCGYCIPGMIMAASALIAWNDAPDETEIRRALEKNLCRCGAHPRILAAIRSVRKNRDET